jgi:hypothetical protein
MFEFGSECVKTFPNADKSISQRLYAKNQPDFSLAFK